MPITVTNIGAAQGSSVASYSITGVTVPAGRFIAVLVVDGAGVGSAGAVTDSAGNSYALVPASPTAHFVPVLFYAWNSKALSSGTITYTKINSSAGSLMEAFYATGVQTSADPYDSVTHAVTDAAGGTNNPVTSGIPSAAGEFFIGGCAWNPASSFTQDTANGWASPPPLYQGYGLNIAGGTLTNPTATAKTFNPTVSANSGWGSLIAGFKSVPVAAAGFNMPMLGM